MPATRAWSPVSLALGLALVLTVGALAYPLLARAPGPEEARPDDQGGPGPDTDGDGGDPKDDVPVGPVDPPPDGPWDAHLVLNATHGPRGGARLDVDNRLWGTNIWYTNGWWPERDPRWVAMLQAIKPGVLRWPSGHPGQHYCFDPESDGTPYPGCPRDAGTWILPAKQLDAFVDLAHDVGAEPLVAINVKKGTPEMAAAVVHHLNVERKLDVTWFHLGNEPDLGGDDSSLPRFTADWKRYSDAMRAVDPSIRLVGPEVMTGADVMGIHGRKDWVRPFLEGNPGDVDGISWHLYPLDSENRREASGAHPSVAHLLQYWAEDWNVAGIRFVDVAQEKLRNDRRELMPGAEIWVTELGPDSGAPGAPGITDGQVAAVWFADVLGRFAEGDADAVMQFAFDHWVPGRDELSLIKRGEGFDPLPPWYTYWLYAETWGTRASVIGATSDDDANVSAHAALRPDGKLAAVLVNKQSAPADARLTVAGYGRITGTSVWEITAPSATSLDARVNGRAIDADRFDESTRAITPKAGPLSTDAVWRLPPYSVTFVVFEPEP